MKRRESLKLFSAVCGGVILPIGSIAQKKASLSASEFEVFEFRGFDMETAMAIRRIDVWDCTTSRLVFAAQRISPEYYESEMSEEKKLAMVIACMGNHKEYRNSEEYREFIRKHNPKRKNLYIRDVSSVPPDRFISREPLSNIGGFNEKT